MTSVPDLNADVDLIRPQESTLPLPWAYSTCEILKPASLLSLSHAGHASLKTSIIPAPYTGSSMHTNVSFSRLHPEHPPTRRQGVTVILANPLSPSQPQSRIIQSQCNSMFLGKRTRQQKSSTGKTYFARPWNSQVESRQLSPTQADEARPNLLPPRPSSSSGQRCVMQQK